MQTIESVTPQEWQHQEQRQCNGISPLWPPRTFLKSSPKLASPPVSRAAITPFTQLSPNNLTETGKECQVSGEIAQRRIKNALLNESNSMYSYEACSGNVISCAKDVMEYFY